MKEFWNAVQFVFTAVGGWLGYFLGGCDGLLFALLMCKDITAVSFILQYLKDGTGRPYGVPLFGLTAEFRQGIGNLLTGASV